MRKNTSIKNKNNITNKLYDIAVGAILSIAYLKGEIK